MSHISSFKSTSYLSYIFHILHVFFSLVYHKFLEDTSISIVPREMSGHVFVRHSLDTIHELQITSYKLM